MSVLLSHYWVGVQFLLLPGFVIVGIVALPTAIMLRRIAPVTLREGTILLVGLSSCGYITGVIAGNSQSPIAQTIVTGLIGLLGGLVAYIHTRETTRASGLRTTASLALVSLLISLLLGLIVGGSYKAYHESYKGPAERYLIYFKEVLIPICLEEKKLALAGNVKSNVSTACQSIENGL